jgi:hypothetical protein
MVGVIDTGIDGTHPDIAPNFNAELSRNFTTDLPDIDGGSGKDAANVDDNGHGTHVASTIASPINGLGIAGVAPNVTLVNIRAGQDSGYFFLQPTLDALTYAGDIGVDVVNMSFYTDPWLYNCLRNPADSPAEQQEQKTIREATQRALVRRTRLQQQGRLRLLPVPAGHLDGLPTRRRGGRADCQPLRQGRPCPPRADPRPAQDRGPARRHRDGPTLPARWQLHLHTHPGQWRDQDHYAHVPGNAGPQRLLRRGHRQRPDSRQLVVLAAGDLLGDVVPFRDLGTHPARSSRQVGPRLLTGPA